MNSVFCVAILTLSTLFATTLAAQESTLTALRRVQDALHAAENAQLALLGTGRKTETAADIDRAVERLTAARKTLRTWIGLEVFLNDWRRQLRTPEGPVLIRADKWTEWHYAGKFLDRSKR